MNEVIQNRLNSNNKSQDIKFKHETPESMNIKERKNRERFSHKAMMKANQNQETSELLPQDDNVFRIETPNSFSIKDKQKREQQKSMRKLQRSESSPIKSQPEPRPNETIRSNSLPNNHAPSSEFCYSNSVSNISFSSWDETHSQNLFLHQLASEPETYYMQTLGRNNEAYDDNKALTKKEELAIMLLNGGTAYPNLQESFYQEIGTTDLNCPSNSKINPLLYLNTSDTTNMREFTVPQFQENNPNNYSIDLLHGLLRW
ncbi:751_t:CDS:2 [Gigaspora margarita]|uniref:751_t:CDS:1 n=1 Tax=Gigaspora margarita TaxID=4874 RepID=A0ABN7VE58_GIGMA|nr:751_t:CDS:2 [Gigaspora margarita]